MELCQVAGVSRAGYYRFQPRVQESEADMDLRSAIQQIALEWPSYDYRRVHRELMRRGWRVNHKRVLRRMRMDNLLCLRKRNFILTTDSHHGLPIYPNLAKNMVLTGINQLWIADITYIRLEVEFVYLAVLLDAFSRSCIGWALQRSLEAGLVLEALRMALRQRRPQPGLVHHSDRGVQYAAGDYIALLKKHGIKLSLPKTPSELKMQRFRAFMRSCCYHDELSFRRFFVAGRLQLSNPCCPAGGDPRASSPTHRSPKERAASFAPPALRPAFVGFALAMVARLAPESTHRSPRYSDRLAP